MWISVKIFPGVRIGGRIGGRKRRRRPGPPRKPLPTPVKVGLVVFGGVITAWALVTQPDDNAGTPASNSTAPPTTSAGRVVHHTDIAGWPLTVDAVTLACIDHRDTTATANGTVYALNSAASLTGRWPELTPLLRGPVSDQDVYRGLNALVAEGDKLC